MPKPSEPIEIDLTLKNYRCFVDEAPARITLKPGFTALVGKNNSGKSTLLRSIYEFRGAFRQLSDINVLGQANTSSNTTMPLPPTFLILSRGASLPRRMWRKNQRLPGRVDVDSRTGESEGGLLIRRRLALARSAT